MTPKEKIFNHLKEKMVKTSLSERTLQGIADSFSAFFSDENALTDESLETILSHAKSLEGQYSHDLSQGLEEAKKKLVPPPPGPQETKLPEELTKKLQDYDNLFAELKKEREARAQKAQNEQLASDIKKGLLEKGCEDNIFLKLALTQVDFAKDANANIDMLKATYDREYADSVEKGAFIPKTITATGAPVSEEQRKAMMEESLNDLRERHKI